MYLVISWELPSPWCIQDFSLGGESGCGNGQISIVVWWLHDKIAREGPKEGWKFE